MSTSPRRASTMLPSKHLEPQLPLDFGDLALPAGPSWESLPESARIEVVAVLARLLARAGLAEEESDA